MTSNSTILNDIDQQISTLAAWRDPIGVLSVYVGIDPSEETSARPAWAIRLDGELAAILARLRTSGSDDQHRAFEHRLGELAPALARLCDPAQHGRGRALFAGVVSGDVETIAVQALFPTRARLSARADLVPLLAVDEGAAIGLVTVGRNVVRILETRLGEFRELQTLDVEPVVSEGAERKGPAKPNPLRAQQVVAQRERFDRHVESLHERRLVQAARQVAQTAAESHWGAAVVAGDRRGAGPLADALRTCGVDVELVDRTLESLPAAAALRELGPAIAQLRSRRDLALVERVRASTPSAGSGALGLAETLTMLAERRVDHLLLDPAGPLAGTIGPAGELLPLAMTGDAARTGLQADPSLPARLVADAIESGARVTALAPESALGLADAEGVAALRRW